jgi:hypothetical protein
LREHGTYVRYSPNGLDSLLIAQQQMTPTFIEP